MNYYIGWNYCPFMPSPCRLPLNYLYQEAGITVVSLLNPFERLILDQISYTSGVRQMRRIILAYSKLSPYKNADQVYSLVQIPE